MEDDDYILNQLVHYLNEDDKILLETLRDHFDDINMQEYIDIIVNNFEKGSKEYSDIVRIEFELQLCLYLIDLGKESGNISAIVIGKNKLEEIDSLDPGNHIDELSYNYNLGNAYGGIAILNSNLHTISFFDEKVYKNYIIAKYYYTNAFQSISNVNSIYDAKLFTNYAQLLGFSNRFLEETTLLTKVINTFPSFAHSHNLLFMVVKKYFEITDYETDFLKDKYSFHLTKAIEFGKDGSLQKVLLNCLIKRYKQESQVHDIKKRVNDYIKDLSVSNQEFENFSEYEKFSHINGLVLNSYSVFTNAYGSQFDSISIIENIPLSEHKFEIFEQILNLLKSEFSHSRFLYYESLNQNSEKKFIAGTHIFELFDCIPHSYEIQALRTSFRIAYSILDKISVAVMMYSSYCENNSFEKEPKNIRNTKFTNFVYSQTLVNKFFKKSVNPFSFALFSLVTEVNIDDKDKDLKVKTTLVKLKEIRNNLEHNILLITENEQNDNDQETKLKYFDQINKKEFIYCTLELLQFVRNAIIYFAEFMRFELRKRNDGKNSDDIISIPLLPK